MLKRLLIAVFVLSLIMAFSGTAFSGVDQDGVRLKENTTPVVGNLESDVLKPYQHQLLSPAERGQEEGIYSGTVMSKPSAGNKGVDTTACFDQDYFDYAGTLWNITWTRSGGDPREIGMRQSITNKHFGEIDGAWIYLALAEDSNTVDGIDIAIRLYNSVGGLPDDGGLLHTEIVNIAQGATGFHFIPFTGAPIVVQGEYHVTMANVDSDPSDVVRFLSDDGGATWLSPAGTATGTGRSVYRSGGVWGTMFDVTGFDYNLLVSTVGCEYFSDCYYNIPPITDFWLTTMPQSVPRTDGSTRNGWGQRFVATGPETLKVVDIWHYALNTGDGVTMDGFYSGSAQTNGVEVSVWGDLAGSVDVGSGPLATVTLPASIPVLFPFTGDVFTGWDLMTADFSAFNLVLLGAYHITAKATTNDYTQGTFVAVFSGAVDGLSDGSVNYDPTEPWTLTGSSFNWTDPAATNLWPCAFDIEPYLCKDEFNLCETQVLYGPGERNWYGLGTDSVAQRFKGQAVNRVEAVRFQLIDEDGWSVPDPPGAYGDPLCEVAVRLSVGGDPGPIVWADTLDNALGEITYWPGWTEVVIPTSEQPQIVGDFVVSINNISADVNTDYYYHPINEDADGINGGAMYYRGSVGAWVDMGDVYAGAGYTTLDLNLLLEADFCAIPFNERDCTPLADPGWNNFQGNEARTGASQLSVGDAWCDYTLNWNYEALNFCSFTGPIIYNDQVFVSFTDHYVIFNGITGAPVATLDGTLGDGQIIGDNVRNPALVKNIGGMDLMFISGGTTNGVAAVNLATMDTLWSRTVLSVGPIGLFGQSRFTPFQHFTFGADEVIVYGTDNGKVAAVDAFTGALYAGWATNPVQLTGGTFVSGSTDGTQLFYATSTVISGDVYALDAATGVINWQLSSAGGLQGVTVHAPGADIGGEHFTCGTSYNAIANEVYAYSRMDRSGTARHGTFYILDAATGNLATGAVKVSPGLYTVPIIDINNVYLLTYPAWSDDDFGSSLMSVDRSAGTLAWTSNNQDDPLMFHTGFLTCEVEEADLLYAFGTGGFLECIDSRDGNQIYRRRSDNGLSQGMGGAIGTIDGTTHILFADRWGGLYDMTEAAAPRPRLEIQTYELNIPVEFGTNPALLVDGGPLVTNTGCADLNFLSVTVDELSITGTTLPGFAPRFVDEDFYAEAQTIASDIVENTIPASKAQVKYDISEENPLRDINREKAYSYAAGIPAFFGAMVHPVAGDILAPGDTMNLEFTVDQGLINRGPQSFYVALETDDPDFFLDDVTKIPEIKVTCVGGCLIDSISLFFGTGGTNIDVVTNTVRLGTGDWDPHAMEIDGVNAAYYQGAYVFGVSQYRVATHSQDWTSGGGEADALISAQPDPDFCDDACAPLITTGVSVGAMSTDGLTYTPLVADMVCKSLVDSVQNFDIDPEDTSTVWDWTAFGGPFDDTLTMGLRADSRIFGVSGVPEFHNFTLEIYRFEERNGNSVPDWYIAHMVDYDVGSDTVQANFGVSAAWSTNQTGFDAAWGTIKVPFGCGVVGAGQDFDYVPLINAKGMTGGQAFFDITAYWDSVYTYMSSGAGMLPSQNMSADDGEVHMTLAGHDFDPNGTYSFGLAQFGFAGGLADGFDPNTPEIVDLAHFINKWAGFGRGDVNNDGFINLADIVYLAAFVNNGGPGAIPFAHLGDVNADGGIDMADVNYLMAYYFDCGACPMGDWAF